MIIDPNGVLKHSGIGSIEDDRKNIGRKTVFDEDEINFLLFTTNDGTPKAIPLELVSRLEEVDYANVEESAGKKVVQYRGNLMKLISIDGDAAIPNEGVMDTIVFTDRKRVLGVYVKEIVDIVKQKMELQSLSTTDGILGSMIMKDQATEIVDISHFISKEFDDWLGHSEANKTEEHIEKEHEDERKHVLLVDDSAFFRKFMRPVILASGYRVTTCEDGQEGYEVLQEHGQVFDVVITDIDMPRMNGVEFVTAAKKHEQFKNIPFIALTSHEEEDFDQDIKDIGFEALVTKANRNKVINIITEMLRDKKISNG